MSKQVKIETSGELMFMTEGETTTYRLENFSKDNPFVMIMHLTNTENASNELDIGMFDNAKISITLEYDCEIEDVPISA